MNSELKRKAYKVTVTGKFDLAGYRRMSTLLEEFGSVQSTFFDAASGNMAAAATFMVSTVHDADDVRALLTQSPGVHLVNVEANDA